jgi:hypothetical protein
MGRRLKCEVAGWRWSRVAGTTGGSWDWFVPFLGEKGSAGVWQRRKRAVAAGVSGARDALTGREDERNLAFVSSSAGPVMVRPRRPELGSRPASSPRAQSNVG